MTKYVVDISGEFRNSDEGVFDDRGRCIFIAPSPYLVPSLMDDYLIGCKMKKIIRIL